MEEFKNKIIQGDCLIELKTLDENSIDSIVTDPPYELGFMGKSWDNSGIAYSVPMWKECLRVLKPGGHLLSFSGTRTYHRMAVAIEDAGFEVRDMIEWCYGSGFPKSRNITLDMDKMEGHGNRGHRIAVANRHHPDGTLEPNGEILPAYIPKSENAIKWNGWGTALKPAHEPICLARKPLAEKTVAQNVLKYGTGGINIDESRVGTDEMKARPSGKSSRAYQSEETTTAGGMGEDKIGRFPANLIHDNSEEVRECFPETGGGKYKAPNARVRNNGLGLGTTDNRDGSSNAPDNYGDSGNASRFFKSILYYPKASKSERNKGCEEMKNNKPMYESHRPNYENTKGIETPYAGAGRTGNANQNNHPTVKPTALMSYLIKMITPKGGVVLDPFAGSGSTLVAARDNNFQYIGIEMTEEYIPIIEARLLGVENDLFKDTL